MMFYTWKGEPVPYILFCYPDQSYIHSFSVRSNNFTGRKFNYNPSFSPTPRSSLAPLLAHVLLAHVQAF